MIVYISGPISGDSDYREKFITAQRVLEIEGHQVVNPAEVGEHVKFLPYQRLLEMDLVLLQGCEAVYMLRGWEYSPGAKVEFELARTLKKKIMFADDAAPVSLL